MGASRPVPHIARNDIRSEKRIGLATFRLISYTYTRPLDAFVEAGDDYVVDLSLTPRLPNARGTVLGRQSRESFERIGEIFFVPAQHRMHGRSDGGRQASINCRLDAGHITQWFEQPDDWTTRSLGQCLSVSSPAVRSTLLRIAGEVRNPGFACEPMLELLTAQLAIDLSRRFRELSDEPYKGGLAPWQLRVIDDRLRGDPTAPTLADLALLCGISRRQLSRGFRVSRGISVWEHIDRCRVSAAQQMIGSGVCIKQVSFALGFATSAGFTYAFRRATGMSPRQYRQQVTAI